MWLPWIITPIVSVWAIANVRSLTAYDRRVSRTLGPLIMPLLTVKLIIDLFAGDISFGARIPAACWSVAAMVYYLIYRRKDDDDDWKKLLRKAAGRVERLGHRLVVVPA